MQNEVMKKILVCGLVTIGLACGLRAQTYTPGDRLLNVPGRGHAQWGQAKNNNNECNPSYNMHLTGVFGMYVYTLVVDGQIIDSKRMILTQ